MKKLLTILIATALAISTLLTTNEVYAQTENDVLNSNDETKYGVGFQSAFPAYGISGMMDFTDKITGQAILGFFGNLKTFAARGLYKFQQEDYWDLYGYGMLGVWNYSLLNESETVPGFGLGGGLSYDWRALDEELPPIRWNIELGIGIVNFDDVDYNFSAILFGAGVHYRF